MKFSAITLSAIFLLAVCARGQKNHFSVSFGGTLGLPLNFTEGYNAGFGMGLRAFYRVTNEGSVLVNINGISFPTKFAYGGALDITALKIGYLTFFNSSHLFVYCDAGLAYEAVKYAGTSNGVGLGAGLGYSIPIFKILYLDLASSFNIAFQSGSDRTWLDIHAAYRFAFSRK